MKYKAMTEDYWKEWVGTPEAPEGTTWFYAETYVDVFHLPVYQELSKELQRAGISTSQQDAYRLVDSCSVIETFAGYVDESLAPFICDEFGYTETGSLVDETIEITIAEVSLNG